MRSEWSFLVPTLLSVTLGQVIEISMNGRQSERITVINDETIRFSLSASDSQSGFVVFNPDVQSVTQTCSSRPTDTDYYVLLGNPTQLPEGLFFEVGLSILEQVRQGIETVSFGLIDQTGRCMEDRVFTFDVLERVNTLIPWNFPEELAPRWMEDFQLTKGERITFDVLQDHNLIELTSEEAFEQCNFEAVTIDDIVVDNNTTKVEVDFGDPEEVRFFSCNKTDTEITDRIVNDCESRGQRIRITVVERGEELPIDWDTPQEGSDVPTIDSNQPIRFFSREKRAVRQFFSKEDFDACRFFYDTGEDPNGWGSSREIPGMPGNGTSVLFRDFLQGTTSQFTNLYFGILDPICEDPGLTACECGWKKQVRVNLINTEEDDEEGGGSDDILYALIGGVFGGLCLLTMVVVGRNRNSRERQTSFALKQALNRYEDQIDRSPDSVGIETLFDPTVSLAIPGRSLAPADEPSFLIPKSENYEDQFMNTSSPVPGMPVGSYSTKREVVVNVSRRLAPADEPSFMIPKSDNFVEEVVYTSSPGSGMPVGAYTPNMDEPSL